MVGNFDVSGGEWVTLELDLEEAAKERGLELNCMWRMWMCVDSARKCQLKDIRLAQADTPSEYPIRQDPNATIRRLLGGWRDLIIINDEAHHVWDPDSAWNEAISHINNNVKSYNL